MKKTIILLLYLGFLVSFTQAQNEKFKALFMYNFTKYVEWPASLKSGNFVIGVLGNSTISEELKVIAGKQKVGGQTIVVKVCSSVSDVEGCHMLYIPSNKSESLSEVTAKFGGKPLLIVTDKEGLASRGACINFVLDGSKLRYEISKSNIDTKGLGANSSLFSLGIPVN